MSVNRLAWAIVVDINRREDLLPSLASTLPGLGRRKKSSSLTLALDGRTLNNVPCVRSRHHYSPASDGRPQPLYGLCSMLNPVVLNAIYSRDRQRSQNFASSSAGQTSSDQHSQGRVLPPFEVSNGAGRSLAVHGGSRLRQVKTRLRTWYPNFRGSYTLGQGIH